MRLEPDPDHPWWTVLGTPAGQAPWHASFDARTPAETILAFAQALTHPDDAPANDPLQSLAEAGWIPGIGQRSLHKRHSPDQLAAWDLRNHDGATAWVATCRIHGQTLWHAAFSARAPLPVVTAFVTSLADSRPLPRRPEAVPPLARTYTASRPATSTQPALPPQLAKPPSPGRTR
ncbi:hypothetical protein T261_0849 [Streptomyces lydicus]|nr:hypothetical protein T261_0849 [Streptomyces lydicus]